MFQGPFISTEAPARKLNQVSYDNLNSSLILHLTFFQHIVNGIFLLWFPIAWPSDFCENCSFLHSRKSLSRYILVPQSKSYDIFKPPRCITLFGTYDILSQNLSSSLYTCIRVYAYIFINNLNFLLPTTGFNSLNSFITLFVRRQITFNESPFRVKLFNSAKVTKNDFYCGHSRSMHTLTKYVNVCTKSRYYMDDAYN